MKRPGVQAAAASGGMPDDVFAKNYPTLSEFLGDDKYDDGSPRLLSAVQLKVQDGAILAVLQDHDLERSLFVVGETLGEAFKALEKHAQDPGADWRRWGNKKAQKKR